jgi:hypothetical protein
MVGTMVDNLVETKVVWRAASSVGKKVDRTAEM